MNVPIPAHDVVRRSPLPVFASPRTPLLQYVLLLAGVALFSGIWLAELNWTSLVPPFDNIEQITWVGALELGYYKHPPLTTWLFWLPAHWFGASPWTTYVLGALCTVAALLMMGRLLLEARGPRYAAIAVLATACVTYYNGRLYYYNHNVVLMLFVSASAYATWRAAVTGARRWWIAIGVTVGLGFITKYQMAVTLASMGAFWAKQGGWQHPAQRRHAALAIAVAGAIFLPHAIWLFQHDFAPVHYAMSSSLGVGLSLTGRLTDSSHWLADQLLNRALPSWLMLGCLTVSSLHRQSNADVFEKQRDAARVLLLAWGWTPVAFMPIVGLLFGSDLQLQWGTPFLLFLVPAVMEMLCGRAAWERIGVARCLAAFVSIQAVLLAVNVLTSPKGPRGMRDNHWREFDSQQLAQVLEEPAHRALGSKVCLVSGPGRIAGALALSMHDHPQVLIEGRYDISPWVTVGSDCGGVLELVDSKPLPGFKAVGPKFPHLFWRTVRRNGIR
jgi:hypothetical protein